jgi:hypothetical protein
MAAQVCAHCKRRDVVKLVLKIDQFDKFDNADPLFFLTTNTTTTTTTNY